MDSIESIYFDNLDSYKEQDSFNQYFEEIYKLKLIYKNHFNSFKNRKKGKELRVEKTFALFEKYTVYREPKTDIEIQFARKYYSDKIYWTKKKTGNNSLALNIGLKASTYIADPILLDTFSYFIERQIGLIYNKQEDETRAIFYLEKCIPGIKSRKKFNRLSKIYLNIGSAYVRLKNYTKAVSYYNLGIEAGRKINCIDCIFANRGGLRDLAFSKRDYPLFVKLANDDRRFLRSYVQTKNIRSRLLALEDKLGSYYYNHKQYSKALPLFIKVNKAILENNTSTVNRDLAKLNLKIAQCYKSLGKKNEFRKEIVRCIQYLLPKFNEILPPDSLLYAESNFIDIFSVCCDFFVSEYKLYSHPALLDSSLLFLEKAIKVGQLLDQKIIYSNSKSLFADNSKYYVDLAVEIAYQKQKETAFDSNDWQRIRSLFNASKDQILRDKIELLGKIKSLKPSAKNEADSLISIIVSELGQHSSNKKSILDCQDQIEKIIGYKFNAQNYIELKSDYLEYLVSKDSVFLLAKIDSVYHFLNLGSKNNLHLLIDTFNQVILEREDTIETHLALTKLSSFLIPENITLPYTFTIIPDEKITTLPFDLLIREDTYLIENHITNVSTHYLQKESNSHKKQSNLFCVNPEYNQNTNIPIQNSTRSGIYPLPFAKEEVKYIKTIFSSSFEAERSSTPLEIIKKLEGANIFHFSGHAKVNKDSAYLVLNDDKGINKWSFDQIYHNNLNLSLVTLSACETGLGEVQNGDGLNSVARSFLGAGCDAVIYSLWTVNDMSTATIMKGFYSDIYKGIPKNEALRDAKLKYLRTSNPDTRHPYFWGGFVAAGDMSPLYVNSNFQFKYLWSIGFLALIFIIYKTLKTKYL